jgi:hypothetical protein
MQDCVHSMVARTPMAAAAGERPRSEEVGQDERHRSPGVDLASDELHEHGGGHAV